MNDTMIEEYLEQEGLRILKKLNESIKTPKHNSVLINSQRLLTRDEKADDFLLNIIMKKLLQKGIVMNNYIESKSVLD